MDTMGSESKRTPPIRGWLWNIRSWPSSSITLLPRYEDFSITLDGIIEHFNFNPMASKVINSYQKKISHYDKQQWDRSVEDHILMRTESVAKNSPNGLSVPSSSRINSAVANDLIDLDLISGSAYTMKSKSQQGWISMFFSAILRVLFFPLYLKWWSEQTSTRLVGLLLMLYILQIVSIRLYYQKNFSSFSMPSSSYNHTNGSMPNTTNKLSNEFADISPTEVLIPIIMMIVLGIIHTQIVGTKAYKSSSLSSSSNLFHHSSLKNSKNSGQTYSNGDVNHHTDCSSSSASSSTTSSVDSSPVMDVRHRIQNRRARMEKFKNTPFDNDDQNILLDSAGPKAMAVPKIRLPNDYEDEQQRPDVIENDYNFPERSRGRFTESHGKAVNTRRRFRLRPNFKTNSNKSHVSWSYEEDNLNSSPISMRSNLEESSFDSEGTISPMTPIMIPGDQWSTFDANDNNGPQIKDGRKSAAGNYFSYETIRSQSNGDVAVAKNDGQLNNMEAEDSPQKTALSSSSSNNNELKVSCSVWQHNVCQKMDLSVMDICSAIIRKVETVEHSTEYIYLGIIFSMTIALLPSIFRLQYSTKEVPSIANILSPSNVSHSSPSLSSTSSDASQDLQGLFSFVMEEAFFYNRNSKIRFVIIVAMIQRFFLSMLYFFLLCVTERTFKQRFLYSKYFSHITRRDRAKRSQIPHFRLHKVRNLKVWLSVRSYMRRYGPHRSVDTICSTTFIISICLLTCICLQILRESNETCTSRLICWEMIFWSLALGLYIMRLMILGSRINQKYRSNLSVLMTEQINLYLQLERKPHKKDALMVANQVLKLAVDLLKELESPYKISGFSANPYLYNITKVVVLSAFSAVLTEMLGFKLKLYKIKLIR